MKLFLIAISLIFAFIMSIPVALYSGYIGHMLWTWFMEPITHVAISIQQMIGINIFLGYIFSTIYIILENFKDSSGEHFVDRMASVVSSMITTSLAITFLWAGGWAWHQILL